VKQKATITEKKQVHKVLLQRDNFVPHPSRMQKGNSPKVFGRGITIDEANEFLLELGIKLTPT